MEKQKTGVWKREVKYICVCSVCGEEPLFVPNETGGAYAMTPFCPWCGSEMEEEDV